MKVLIIAASLALSGCITPIGAPTSGAAAVGETVVLTGTHKLQLAADAYYGAATVVEAAVRNGVFNREQLLQIRSLNSRALGLLEAGNTGLSVAERSAGLFTIADELRSLVGGQ